MLLFKKHVSYIFAQKAVRMLGKGTKLYSILRMKCPRCHEGAFFEGHPYKLSTMGKVKKNCPKCDAKFEIETGFYQGSYYVAYSLGVALFVAVVAINFTVRQTVTPVFLMLSFFIALIVLFPLIYALSKIIWANLFLKFNKPNGSKTS